MSHLSTEITHLDRSNPAADEAQAAAEYAAELASLPTAVLINRTDELEADLLICDDEGTEARLVATLRDYYAESARRVRVGLAR